MNTFFFSINGYGFSSGEGDPTPYVSFSGVFFADTTPVASPVGWEGSYNGMVNLTSTGLTGVLDEIETEIKAVYNVNDVTVKALTTSES